MIAFLAAIALSVAVTATAVLFAWLLRPVPCHCQAQPALPALLPQEVAPDSWFRAPLPAPVPAQHGYIPSPALSDMGNRYAHAYQIRVETQDWDTPTGQLPAITGGPQ